MSERPFDHQFLRESPERFGLSLQHEHLYCGGVALREIAEKVGTPTYVYNLDHIAERYAGLAKALDGCRSLICYAMKANSNLSVIASLAKLGAGADIVSGGELKRALRAGVDPSRIVFSGVAKSADEIDAALRAQIRSINVESVAEIELVAARAEALDCRARMSLRVNPDVDPETHPYLATGLLGSKFGIDMDAAHDAALRVHQHPRLDLVGIACHIGSMVSTAEPYLACIDRIRGLIQRLRAQGVSLRQLDIGGGLGIAYKSGDPELSVAAWGEPLCAVARELDIDLVVEPGRYLVGNSGVLLTRVQGIKASGAKEYVIVDAAMNDLIRPALYRSHHGIVADPLPAREQASSRCEIVGPVCECGDFLASDRPMPIPDVGQLLVILSAGAYAMTMASNYNTRALPAEVVVSRGAWKVARARQNIDALLDAESLVDLATEAR